MSKPVYIENIVDDNYEDLFRNALHQLYSDQKISATTRVFIKPNLTFPVYRQGVMTNPACVQGMLKVLSEYTGHIIIGEADSGGYNRFNITEVQKKIGLFEMAEIYGAKVVNLSDMEREPLNISGRNISFDFPSMLLHETDLVISAAVPKIHMNTLISMTVKNLWGCIPEPQIRLKMHPHLPDVLRTIVEHLPDTLGVIDGLYGLNRSGPMKGDAVPLNWFMASPSLYTADCVGTLLMQLDPKKVRHLRAAFNAGEGIASLSELDSQIHAEEFLNDRFYLKRAWTDLPGYWAFHSSWLSYLAYFSPLAGVLHKLLYLFREPFYDYEKPEDTAE